MILGLLFIFIGYHGNQNAKKTPKKQKKLKLSSPQKSSPQKPYAV